MSLEARIDELYRLSLGDFTASRNALAKELSGEEAKRVRSLAKPTVVPWAVNQLFWQARPVYDRLLKAGLALREAQIAALKGRDADIRHAAEAHRRALADAVARASALASTGGSSPDGDALNRMLEALSLSAEAPDHPGRWSEVVQPAGFEALAGVQPAARPGKIEAVAPRSEREPKPKAADVAGLRQAQRREAERLEAERRRLEANVRSAEQAATQAQVSEQRAREALDRAIEDRRTAEAALASARNAVSDLT